MIVFSIDRTHRALPFDRIQKKGNKILDSYRTWIKRRIVRPKLHAWMNLENSTNSGWPVNPEKSMVMQWARRRGRESQRWISPIYFSRPPRHSRSGRCNTQMERHNKDEQSPSSIEMQHIGKTCRKWKWQRRYSTKGQWESSHVEGLWSLGKETSESHAPVPQIILP